MHFELLLLQAVTDGDGFRIDMGTIVSVAGAIVTTLTTTIAVLYRGQIAALKDRIEWLEGELKQRDDREDRLIDQLGRTAEGLHQFGTTSKEIVQRTARR